MTGHHPGPWRSAHASLPIGHSATHTQRVTSEATWSSNVRLKRQLSRAQGAAATTTPCCRQRTRGRRRLEVSAPGGQVQHPPLPDPLALVVAWTAPVADAATLLLPATQPDRDPQPPLPIKLHRLTVVPSIPQQSSP